MECGVAAAPHSTGVAAVDGCLLCWRTLEIAMSQTPADVRYVVVVQCHITKEVCSGYFCEKCFAGREDAFARYPKDSPIRVNYITCGGCCGKATQRKLANLLKWLAKEGMPREQIVVHLASCITKDNHHGPRCPHAEFIKALVARHGLACVEDTHISRRAQQRREEGLYPPLPPGRG
jgi:predicted metal-binding protein